LLFSANKLLYHKNRARSEQRYIVVHYNITPFRISTDTDKDDLE